MSAREHLFQIEVLDFRRSSYNHPSGSSNHFAFKEADRWESAPSRTVFKRAKHEKTAKNWAKRFGSIISCVKVDTIPYTRNIEFLNLEEGMLTIQMESSDFLVNKTMELSKEPQRTQKIRIEVIDNPPK